MLRTKMVEYNRDGISAKIVCSVASVRQGLLRSKMTDEALRSRREDEDALLHTARWMQWPALVAATVSGEITHTILDGETEDGAGCMPATDIPFDVFLGLPEDLAAEWLGVVFDLNPHWVYQAPPKEGSEGEAKSDV